MKKLFLLNLFDGRNLLYNGKKLSYLGYTDISTDLVSNLIWQEGRKLIDDCGGGFNFFGLVTYNLLEYYKKMKVSGMEINTIVNELDLLQKNLIAYLAKIRFSYTNSKSINTHLKDKKYSGLIQYVANHIGKYGIADLKRTNKIEDIKIVLHNGFIISSDILSPDIFELYKLDIIKFQNVNVAVLNNSLNYSNEFVSLLNICHNLKTPLIIFCKSIEKKALQTMYLNIQKGNIDGAVIRLPFVDDKRIDFMEDMKTFTKCNIASSSISPTDLGTLDSIEINKFDKYIKFSFQNVDIDLDKILNKKDLYSSNLDKMAVVSKVSRLYGKNATVYIGGTNREDLYTDIKNALMVHKNILIYGGIKGGFDFLHWWGLENNEFPKGLKKAVAQVCYNLIQKICGDPVSNYLHPTQIFSFEKKKFVDPLEEGIVDSAYILKEAIKRSCSLVKTLISSGN